MVINNWEQHEADTLRGKIIKRKKKQTETITSREGFLAHKSLTIFDVHGTKHRWAFDGTSCSEVVFNHKSITIEDILSSEYFYVILFFLL